MPSISTLFAVELPPRTKSEVTPPSCPCCTTSRPGAWRSASTIPICVEMSSGLISETAELAWLQRCRNSGCGYCNRFGYRCDFEHNILGDDVRHTAVEVFADARSKGRGAGQQLESAFRGAANFISAVRSGTAKRNDSSPLYQLNPSVDDDRAEGVGNPCPGRLQLERMWPHR